MTFEDYLISKKIDAHAFRAAEQQLFESWDLEFSQMHPNSFTAQKLYLINPIRLKYTLVQKQLDPKIPTTDTPPEEAPVLEATKQKIASVEDQSEATKSPQTSKPPRPVFKPKPKIN